MSTDSNGGHDVPLTPPPANPSADAATPAGPVPDAGASAPVVETAPGRPSKPMRPIGIVLAVIGGVALAGTGATAAFAGVSQLASSDYVETADVSGIQSLDLEVGASDVTVEFGDVDDAELRVDGSRVGSWTLERDADELVVHSPNRGFGWWFGSWFGGEEHVVLTLPESLRTAELDADIDLSAGSLDVSGDFGELDVVIGAGALFLEGSADTVDAEINAGRADIELADVSAADFTVAAGRLVAELTGSAPDEIVFDVSAGSLELTVPDTTYDVVDEVSAGSFENDVEISSSASRTIHATVSAGSAQLRAGD